MRKSIDHNPTIKDVAARAGVSVATASRALSGRGYVSQETRDAVMHAAQELGYRIHAAARSLKTRRTNTIGLLITDIINPFYSYVANGALSCSQQIGYHIILCATSEDPNLEREYLKVLIEERVEGIIAVPMGNDNVAHWRKAEELGIRLVFIDRALDEIPNADVVVVDNVKGMYNAASYLINLGHKRIALINGPTSTTTGHGRLLGYQRALQDANLRLRDELVQIGSFKRESGVQAVHRLLSLPQPPSAILVSNNVLGEAVIGALRERNLRIPQDISLIMFDDVPWASLTSPRITVVAQPTYSIGFISMEMLDQRLREEDGGSFAPTRTVLQPELIIRESCAPYVDVRAT